MTLEIMLAAIVGLSTDCSGHMGCSLNGKCLDAVCVCDLAWKGPACARLAILPTIRNEPAAAYGGDSQLPNMSSWGGSVLRDDDGIYHLWVSEFVNGCGLSAWLSNSQIAHATARTATGPFTKQNTSLGIFSHNVVPLRAPKTFGTGARPYYLFHLGTGTESGRRPKNASGPPIDCSNRSESHETREGDIRRGGPPVEGNLAHRAPHPDGPWEALPSMSPTCNNPAPVWHPNGTLYVACNNGQGSKPWPLFASLDGGFTWTKTAEIATPPSWSTIRDKTAPFTGVEDPFLYFDARGHWHLLVHRYQFSDGPGVAPYDNLVSGHGYSMDGKAWEFSSVPPFDSLISHHTGPATPYTSLERPKLRIDELTGLPTHLIVAAAPVFTTPLCGGCHTRLPGILNSSCVLCKLTAGIDSTFTAVLPLRTSPGAPPCTDDLDCSLAGACVAGVCLCEKWTRGHDCAELNLKPLSSAKALTSAVVPVDGTTRWGGSVVEDRNGTFHMFGAEFANDCSLASWGHQSRVYHAVSDNATGPFTRLGVAVGTEAHNPVMTRDPVDGTWLLFTMGCPYDNSKDQSCAKTNISCGVHGIGAYWTTTVYSSMSLNGPWEPHVDLLGNLTLGWFSGSQNVAPMFNSNGSIVLMFKGTNKDDELQQGQATPCNIATAPQWRGPYTILKYNIFGQYVKDDIVTEDCFLWRQPAGTFQALCHRGKNSVEEPGGNWKTPNVGGHAFARTLDDWRYASTPSYTTEVALVSPEGGSLTIGRRERPQIFLGHDGTPSVLYNAVQPYPKGTAGLDFTFAQTVGHFPYPPPSPTPPGPGPPGTVCDAAKFLNNMEFDDGDGLGEVHAGDAAACCAHCASADWAAKGCKWFSFVDVTGKCFLKADDNIPTSRIGVTSGATHK